MRLEFISLRAFGSEYEVAKDSTEEQVGRQNLAKALLADKVKSKYLSVQELAEKIQNPTYNSTNLKLEGFVVRDITNKSILGFVLYTTINEYTRVTDMFKFEAGRHKKLFRHIGTVLNKTIGWKGDLSEDGNNVKMIPSFNKARPLDYKITL